MTRERRQRVLQRVTGALERADDSEGGALATAVGARVAQERLRRGLSQRELAELCGTTQSAIARLEAGVRPPRLSTLIRVANALDCALEVDLRPRARPRKGRT
ncbi:MAG: helix-turn-helix transcriptional regulator [Actinobacteria bacterium]|nr:helix-turn-helix transcriptional regulator [Actinomycetota bacterium]